MKFNEATHQFITHLHAAGRSDQTMSTYERRFRRFLEAGFSPDQELDTITPELLDTWAASLAKLSPASRLGYIQAIKTLFRFCWRRGWLDRDPAADLHRPYVPMSTRHKAMSSHDFFRMMDVAHNKALNGSGRDLALISLMADTGIRRGEVCNLRVGDLRLDDLEAWVTGKTGERLVDYTTSTREIMLLWLEERSLADVNHDFVFIGHSHGLSQNHGGKLHPDAINSIFRRLAHRAHAKGNINPHSLRHLVGQWWTDRVGNLELVRQKLGHANITTTARFYAHQDLSRVKAATSLYSLTLHYQPEE